MYKYIIMVMKLPKFCPNCGKEINETAQFCEHCGNIISQKNAAQSQNADSTVENNISTSTGIVYHKNIFVAFILSLIVVGLGQIYNGQILKGIIFFIIISLIFGTLGNIGLIPDFIYWILLLLTAIEAAYSAKYINDNNGNYFYNENLLNKDSA